MRQSSTLSTLTTSSPHHDAPPPHGCIDCQLTRYHVVRTAALAVGWHVLNGDRDDVPSVFHGVSLQAAPSPLREASVVKKRPAPQVIWSDKSVTLQRVAGLRCFQRINHFAGMDVIARKARLFRRLMRLSRPTPSDPQRLHALKATVSGFAPRSFSSCVDMGVLQAYSESESVQRAHTFFIVKPNKSCEGRGIRLTRHPVASLTAEERTKEGECLVQQYIDRPLLIEGRKFDLRLYVLLLSIHSPRHERLSRRVAPPTERNCLPLSHTADSGLPADHLCAAPSPSPSSAAADQREGGHDDPLEGVRLLIHRRGLVRICAEPYAAPTESNAHLPSVHLTNYAVNKASPQFHIAPVTGPDHLAPDTDAHTDGEKPATAADADVVVSDGNKRDLDFLEQYIRALPHSWQREAGLDAEEAGKEHSTLIDDSDSGDDAWLTVRRRIDECVTLTVLSGLPILRREAEAAGLTRGCRGDGRGCFELLGFDILLREDTLQPILMEVNHSPSLFCDSDLDFAIKQEVLSDCFRLLQTHLPPASHCASDKLYETYMRQHGAQLQAEEQALVREGKVGFRSLLPCYTGASDGTAVVDWTSEERERQSEMVKTAAGLP